METEFPNRVTEQLDLVGEILERLALGTPDQAQWDRLINQFENLRHHVIVTANHLHATEIRSEALARAQADAIVYSAEVIDELEETRQRLSEARAAAEQAAGDTQRLANTIFDRTHDTIMVFRDGVCVSCNDNALSLFGCRKDDIVGQWPKPLTEEFLDGGTDAAHHLRQCFFAAAAGETAAMEVACRRSDGELVWCEVKLTGFLMQADRHVLMTVCDISSRKKFEEELRRHRDFLNNIINAVPDPLYVSNHRQQLVIVNDSYCRSFDVDRNRVVGKDVREIFPGEQGPLSEETEHEAYEQRGTTEEERTHRTADGTKRIHSVRRSVFDDTVSGDQYVVGIARDVTSQKEREERLNLLASVFNNAAEGVAILTRDGEILEANPRLVEMFGCGALVGRQLNNIIELNIEDFANELVRVSRGEPWSGKISATLAVNEQHWFWLSLSRNEAAECPGNEIIAMFSDVTQLENSQRQLRRQAMHDNLTGLPNRGFYRTYLNELIHPKNGTTDPFTICFMDLDEFKGVNDSLGHGTGDQLLIEVARRLSTTIGQHAFIARFGGDEFAAVFPQRRCREKNVDDCIDALLSAFQEPFDLGTSEVSIGLSIGMASYPFDGTDVESLMSNADIAMYAAKDAGKNHARRFSPKMQERADQRHLIQAELRRVLQGGGISVEFQPKVCTHTGKPHGCEALARWRRADGTMIPPAEFIPIAEQTGVIVPLGEFVLSRTLECCRDWNERGINLFPVAVNISPQQLRSVRFVERLMEILEEYNAEPEWLELEITENAMVEDIGHAITTINRLVDLGFRIAIDDFGTGYSSLSYLRFFRIHTVKIDGSFVSEITTDKKCAAIAESIISLGRGLDLCVVAERVETAEQREVLARAGCDVVQGYLVSRPLTALAIEEWLQSTNVATEMITEF
ncbi:MAG: EAL domain-containing protein [Planctomycetaceae bacterium]|nr:EAL domain-containing protein [Planctomycetaceae bacterium]